MSNFELARAHMIDGQIRPNHVTDPRIIEALRAVPREFFVPKALSDVAYVDEDLEIAPGRYLMEPMIFARLLQALAPSRDDVVLDIGCGSGYSSAVLARLAGAVVALEEDPELATSATARLAELQCDNVAVVETALCKGCPDQAPFDAILINGMVDDVPRALLDLLGEGGRLVLVQNMDGVGKAMIHVREGGVIGHRELFDASVPFLPGFPRPQGFSF